MLSTLWIHRAYACDILVRFDSREKARNFGLNFLEKYGGHDYIVYSFHSESIDVGSTNCVQISIHPGEFHHVGWSPDSSWSPDFSWNTDGTVLVNEEEALSLGLNLVPKGFIPGESEDGLWQKNTKTTEQLDLELETYFLAGKLEDENHWQLLAHTICSAIHKSISSNSLDHTLVN